MALWRSDRVVALFAELSHDFNDFLSEIGSIQTLEFDNKVFFEGITEDRVRGLKSVEDDFVNFELDLVAHFHGYVPNFVEFLLSDLLFVKEQLNELCRSVNQLVMGVLSEQLVNYFQIS
jgi:hypothetical protein